MFVIRSKKTGKTFLRILPNPHGIMRDWCMFREEEPFNSDDTTILLSHTQELGMRLNIDFEIVPLSEVPYAEPKVSALDKIDQILNEGSPPSPMAIKIVELEKENQRLRDLLVSIEKLASKGYSI